MSSFRMAFLLLLTCLPLLLTGLVQGLTFTFTPLKVYTHTPGSVEDYERDCYSSVVEEKGFVKFGVGLDQLHAKARPRRMDVGC